MAQRRHPLRGASMRDHAGPHFLGQESNPKWSMLGYRQLFRLREI